MRRPYNADAICHDERGAIDCMAKGAILLGHHHEFGVDGDNLLAWQAITAGAARVDQLLDYIERLSLCDLIDPHTQDVG